MSKDNNYRKWDFNADDDGLTVCKGEHHRSGDCEFERMSPYDALRVINDLRAQVLRLRTAIQQAAKQL